jgi:hypothetical protein
MPSKNIDRYNQFIIQLIGGASSFAKEIELDQELTDGQRYSLNQQILSGVAPFQKLFDKLEKSYKELAISQLSDLGNNQSDVLTVENLEMYIKYTYPTAKLNSKKLEQELKNAYAEIGTEYKQDDFLTPSTPTKKVIIQPVI